MVSSIRPVPIFTLTFISSDRDGQCVTRAIDEEDWVAELGDQLPVSPLSALGLFLAAVIGVRVAAESLTTRALFESLFPLLAATAVVGVDRWLVARNVSVRDRITVFSYGLGGFLAAFVVTALHMHLLYLDGFGHPDPLYASLLSGTVGVAAGTVAGVFVVRHRRAAREARHQSTRLDEFASVVSHDLRNPLSVAQTMLLEAIRTGEATHLRAVNDSLDRMDALIDETLSVARNGTQVLEPEAHQLVELAADAWDGVETGNATLEIEGNTQLQVDRIRALKLFENLFRNAHEHGGDVTVRVGSLPRGFYVEDDGPGIPADKRETVLEQGVSTTASGSGLGLAIVRAIAEAHDWTVTVTESDAGGARFEFVHA